MLNPDSPLQALLDGPMRPGRLEWIGVRPARHAPMHDAEAGTLDPQDGLAGDHYAGQRGARQVSLIGRENLLAIAHFLGRDTVAPDLLRRNLVVAGINLLSLKERRFSLGQAVLQWTGACHPCSRMEAILGPGGYNAVRGHGGILARVIRGGTVRVGDALARLPSESP